MLNHEVGLPLSGGCVERLHGPGQAICGVPSLVVLDWGRVALLLSSIAVKESS